MKTEGKSRIRKSSTMTCGRASSRAILCMILISLSLSATVPIVQAQNPCSNGGGDRWTHNDVFVTNWYSNAKNDRKNWSLSAPPADGGIACLNNGTSLENGDRTTFLNRNASLSYLSTGTYNWLNIGANRKLDVPSGLIYGGIRNNGLIRTQGDLVFNSSRNVVNTANGIILADLGGTVHFQSTSIQGGTLKTTRQGSIEGKAATLNNLTIDGAFTVATGSWSALLGKIDLQGVISVPNGTLRIAGPVNLVGNGAVVLTDPINSTITGVTFMQKAPDLTIGPDVTVRGSGTIGSPNLTIHNNGIIKTDVGGTITTRGTLENNGLIRVNADSSMNLRTAGFTNNGSLDIAGSATVSAPTEAVNTGNVIVHPIGTASFSSGYVQNGAAAVTTVDGTMNITKNGRPAMGVLNGGAVNGTGTINGGAVNQGIVAPGNPKGGNLKGQALTDFGVTPGMLTLNGDYAEQSDGGLAIQINGTSFDPSDGIFDYSQLSVTGHSSIAGDLGVSLGFVPQYNDAFTILTSTGGLDGIFEGAMPVLNGDVGYLYAGGGRFDVVYNWSLNGPGSVVLTDFVSVPTPEPGSLFLFGSGFVCLSALLRRRLDRTD